MFITYVIVIQCENTELREDWESIKGSFAQKIVTRNQTTQFGELTDVFKITLGNERCSQGQYASEDGLKIAIEKLWRV